MAIRIRSAGKTDVGLKRAENEDNFIMLPDAGLYVLADGMGGHASGKLASTLAVTLVTEFVCVRAKKPDFQWEYPPDESTSFQANVLGNAIKYANERIFIEAMKNPANEGMGTTAVALLDAGDHIAIAWVGDSRVYRVRNNKLELVSLDHSLRNHLISIGELTPENEHKFKNTNVIIRAVGLKDYVEVDTKTLDRVPGDMYMTCSDGLTDLVPDHIIEQVMTRAPDLTTASNTLIKLALQAGGKDNVTVICLRLDHVEGVDDVKHGPPRTHPASDVSPTVPGGGPQPSAGAPQPPQKVLLHAVRHPAAYGVLEAPSIQAPSPVTGGMPPGSQPQGLVAVQPVPEAVPPAGLDHLDGLGPGTAPPPQAWSENTDPEFQAPNDFGHQDYAGDGAATIQEMPAWDPNAAQQYMGGGNSGSATIGESQSYDTPTDLPAFPEDEGSDLDTSPSIKVDPGLIEEANNKVLIDPSLLQEEAPKPPPRPGPPKPPPRPKYRATSRPAQQALPPHLRNRNNK